MEIKNYDGPDADVIDKPEKPSNNKNQFTYKPPRTMGGLEDFDDDI